jgi:hypothetical protein
MKNGSAVFGLMEQPKDELKMQYDLIGLSFYGVSDAYKKKFMTVHSHL